MIFFDEVDDDRKENSNQFSVNDEQKAITMTQRLSKDIAALELPPNAQLAFGKKANGEDDLQNFTVTIRPSDDTFWQGGCYPFKFVIPENYPYEPPKLQLQTKIWHPNIDLEGNVCLNILRKDWKPVLGIIHIIFGLESLFISPNPEDPLNRDAARMMVDDLENFKDNVKRSLRGFNVGGNSFPKMI